MSKKKPPRPADGQHKPDCGQCGGPVTDGHCSRCGADYIASRNITK